MIRVLVPYGFEISITLISMNNYSLSGLRHDWRGCVCSDQIANILWVLNSNCPTLHIICRWYKIYCRSQFHVVLIMWVG